MTAELALAQLKLKVADVEIIDNLHNVIHVPADVAVNANGGDIGELWSTFPR